jgi:hypothetical protein
VSEQNITELLTELRAIIDERERLADQDRNLSRRKSAVEASLLSFHARTGLEKLSGAGLSVTFNPAATRCRYEPDRWEGIVRWAVATGNLHIIQRRTSDAKIIDLIAEGVALPEGLTIESFTDLSVRRTNLKTPANAAGARAPAADASGPHRGAITQEVP